MCSVSGYTLKTQIYSGKSGSSTPSDKGHSEKIVFELLSNYLNDGKVLYCDNFYNGIPMAENLLKEGTYICGTLK